MTERDIFIAALQRDHPRDRQAYLDSACRADATLRGRVDGLLAVYDRAGSFLEEPAAAGPYDSPDDEGPRLEAGAMVAGRYQLLERIGEGGMGEVWLAEQHEPVRRKAALPLNLEGDGPCPIASLAHSSWRSSTAA